MLLSGLFLGLGLRLHNLLHVVVLVVPEHLVQLVEDSGVDWLVDPGARGDVLPGDATQVAQHLAAHSFVDAAEASLDAKEVLFMIPGTRKINF